MMLPHTRRHFMKRFARLAMGVTLLGGCGGAGIGTFKPSIMWIFGIDITTTVPEKHFPIMRDQMFPEIVLSRLRQRDEIHTMPVDSHPERSINLVRLTRATGLAKEVMAIFEDVKTRIKRTQNPRITTNIGGVLAYAKRLSLHLQQEKARTEASGKTASPLPRFVVHVFTDGLRREAVWRNVVTPGGIQVPPESLGLSR